MEKEGVTMFKKVHTILAEILMGSFLFLNLERAQDEKPLRSHNLDCKKEEQHFSGLQ